MRKVIKTFLYVLIAVTVGMVILNVVTDKGVSESEFILEVNALIV